MYAKVRVNFLYDYVILAQEYILIANLQEVCAYTYIVKLYCKLPGYLYIVIIAMYT